MIPGSNLLKLALTVIAKQTVQYSAFLSRSTNAAGVDVPAFAAPVPITGSFQPVPRSYYVQLGLEFEKTYATWYDPQAAVNAIQRTRAGDRIDFGGTRYEALSQNDWRHVDGWTGTIFVRIGDTPV
jgi:hypothetical protein